jgi:CubicO group peptidase (beta-lactamase class C family)
MWTNLISMPVLMGVLFLAPLAFSCSRTTGEVKPEKVGMRSDSLQAADKIVKEYVDDGKIPGISTLVMKDGKIVQRTVYGMADLEKDKPMQEQQIFRIFSMSKPVTAAALMILYDEGKFGLDDPVADYIPEFDQTMVYLADTYPPVLIPQNKRMTIRHLLTHTAGFTYGWNPYHYVDSLYNAMKPPMWESPNLAQFTTRISALPLKFQPGNTWEYSISIDICGYLVEVLSGKSLEEFMDDRIFSPLKMDDTGFWVPDSSHHRMAMVYLINYQDNSLQPQPMWVEGVQKPVTLFSGGGGLVSTIEDYARFGQMLVNGGMLDGERILEKSTVELIVSNQLPEGVVYYENEGYGLGGLVDYLTGGYGWAGMASTFFMVYPDEELVTLCFSQFMPMEKYNFSREYMAKVVGSLR